jgi:signal transduction histidine kinase
VSSLASETSIQEWPLHRLAALIERERDTLLQQWRESVRELPGARGLDVPTLNDHVPQLLDELTAALRSSTDTATPVRLLETSAPAHGRERFEDGFDIVEVVAEYNILRGCIHDLGERHDVPLRGRAFHVLNRVLDDAIGLAVQTYATQQTLEAQRRREEHLAFVAHDLRTPLGAISLAARGLEAALPDAHQNAQAARLLRTLHRNERHLAELVETVLKETADVAGEAGVTPQRRRLDLWPLVEAVLRDLQPVADTAGVELRNDVPDTLVAFADAGLLRRVLQNLVTNAITFAPRGLVVVGARSTGPEGGIECWVRDTGAGIPAARLGSLFGDGNAETRRTSAHGLGLPIVKSFVEAHGGRVRVESIEGHGATFRFTLPGP